MPFEPVSGYPFPPNPPTTIWRIPSRFSKPRSMQQPNAARDLLSRSLYVSPKIGAQFYFKDPMVEWPRLGGCPSRLHSYIDSNLCLCLTFPNPSTASPGHLDLKLPDPAASILRQALPRRPRPSTARQVLLTVQ